MDTVNWLLGKRDTSAPTMCGVWFQPRRIIIVEGHKPGHYKSENGEISLEVTEQREEGTVEEEGKVHHWVTLTDNTDGFTADGKVNFKCTRVQWCSGAAWAKKGLHPDGLIGNPNSKIFHGKSHFIKEGHHVQPKVIIEEPRHEAPQPFCCGSTPMEIMEEEEDDGAQPACCSLFGMGSKRTVSATVTNPGEPGPPDPPRVPGEGKRLPIEIISARGLRNADWAQLGHDADAYCKCCVVGNEGNFSVRTPIIVSASPVWDHADVMIDYRIGDALLFEVWDKDTVGKDFLGRVILQSEQFHPDGFDGEIALEDAGEGIEAFLTVHIAPAEELRQASLLSDEQIDDIVDRVNENWDIWGLTESMERRIILAMVRMMNRKLRSSLLTFCAPGWVNALTVCLNSDAENEVKARQMADCLNTCFRDPLVASVIGKVRCPAAMKSAEAKLIRLIVSQITNELVDVAAQGVTETGLCS